MMPCLKVDNYGVKKLNQESQKWMQQMVKNIKLNERTYFSASPAYK